MHKCSRRGAGIIHLPFRQIIRDDPGRVVEPSDISSGKIKIQPELIKDLFDKSRRLHVDAIQV
jgi:hypothetical protein